MRVVIERLLLRRRRRRQTQSIRDDVQIDMGQGVVGQDR
jgi:hypothetical protein